MTTEELNKIITKTDSITICITGTKTIPVTVRRYENGIDYYDVSDVDDLCYNLIDEVAGYVEEIDGMEVPVYEPYGECYLYINDNEDLPDFEYIDFEVDVVNHPEWE